MTTTTPVCCVAECDNRPLARHMCNLHWKRWRAHGSTDLPARTSRHVPVKDRFLKKLVRGAPDECWAWQGTINGDGYGVIAERVAGVFRQYKAHRLAHEIFIGPIPDDLLIDHQCRNPACVNPNHLLAATTKQNGENRVANRGSGSQFRGVSYSAARRSWKVAVGHAGTVYYGGSFNNEHDANEAAVALRNRLFSNNVPDRPAELNPFVRVA